MKQVLFFLCVLFLVALPFYLLSQEKPYRTSQPEDIAAAPQSLPLNINQMFSGYNANGLQENRANPFLSPRVMFSPTPHATTVIAGGVFLGGGWARDGRNPIVRVGGGYFSSSLANGAILGTRTGIIQSTSDSSVRMYRIRSDFRKIDLRPDAAETYGKAPTAVTNSDLTTLRAAYAKDWAGWPWQFGAPFYDVGYLDANKQLTGANNNVLDWGEDVNRNAFLDPGEDVNRNGVLDGESPGYADADMVLWFVSNDIGGQRIFSSQPVGMEMQGTIWAYNRPGAMGNVIYKRFRLVYKGSSFTTANATIDSLYIGHAADPDIGDALDDFAGCDSLLNLGFVYNATAYDRLFSAISLPPPTIGYDLMQGPVVRGVAGKDLNRNGIDDASDYAIINLKSKGPGYINLPMTSFVFFDFQNRYASRAVAPGFGNFQSTAWYQTLRGLPPSPIGPPDPPLLINPTTLTGSSYWASGDPVLRYGWIDGAPLVAGDRDFILSSGPLTMALGDTQEVVFAVVGGLGTDNIASIKVMKYNDKVAQVAYNNAFKQPKAPAPPNVKVFSMDGQILLEWGLDSLSVAESEVPVLFGNYRFEGYNVYQVPDGATDLTNAKRIATFDLINGIRTISQDEFDVQAGEIYLRPVQYGTDSGIRRSFLISQDQLWNRPLVNGQNYYFAVTSYNYTPDATTTIRSAESAPVIVRATPETVRPGIVYPYTVGDTIGVRTLVGSSDAVVVPVIYNPRGQSGAAYHLRFDTTTSKKTYKWTLTNASTGKIIYSDITDLSGLRPYRVADGGFELTVSIPPVGLRQVTDQNGNDAYGTTNPNPNWTVLSARRTLRSLNGLGTTQRDYEIRFDGRGSYAVRMVILAGQSEAIKVPFSVWDIGRSSADVPVQVIPSFRDSGNTPTTWNVTPTGVAYGDTLFKIFEPIHITDSPYPTSGDDSAGVYARRLEVFRSSQSPDEQGNAMWGIQIADKDRDGLPPPVGTIIRFIKFHEIRQGDVKEITPMKPSVGDTKSTRADISKINVFPNPYYGEAFSPTGLVRHRVMFSHLPGNATIRIFNLAGNLVKTIIKSDGAGGSQFIEWTLKNEYDLPVASGIYIAYIDMPELNATKTLKLVIIQGVENPNGL